MQDIFHVILVEPRYDGNIGSVARVMKNFGFRKLVLVNPPKMGPEARKNSMHARDIMEKARIVDSFEKVVEEFDVLVGTTAKVGGDANTLRTPVFPEELAKALDAKGKVGIVFGREDYGLLNEELERCDMLVTIPAHHEYPTLNLAQSACIILYELSRESNKKKTGGKKFRSLSKVEKDYMLKFYDELVDEVQDHLFERDLAKRTFRHIVGRSFISGREAKTLMGVFRHARKKINK
ncbi:MAG: RNA methyltransferase [Candidatus Altiarchaeota archaeon]